MNSNNQYIYSYFSQKTERLADQLIDQLSHPTDPFEQTIILVPNSGMQRYVELTIAERFGICSHIQITYPGSFLWDLYTNVLPQITNQSLDNQHLSTFKLFDLIQNHLSDEQFKDILPKSPSEEQIFFLAQNLAQYFLKYTTERPELIDAWETNRNQTQNPHEVWQKLLYQKLHTENPSHRSIQKQFLKTLDSNQDKLPIKLHLFGFHGLLISQFQDLFTLSQYCPILFYVLNPSHEYWGDLRKRSTDLKLDLLTNNLVDESLYFTTGNQLLASWGQAGQYLINQLSEYEFQSIDEQYSNPEPKNLLQFIQNQINHLEQSPPHPIANHHSIEIHVTSSKHREIEVLYNNLLTVFNQGELTPKDVIVIMPNINDYKESIQAVFGTKSDLFRIPYTISNQTSAASHDESKALIATIDLIREKFKRNDFLDWCNQPIIKNRFNFSDADLELIEYWLEREHVSWGLDFEQKKQFIDDEQLANLGHLQKMLDSLYLSYVFGKNTQSSLAVTPSQNFHSGQIETLEKLSKAVQALSPFAKLTNQEKTISQWHKTLQELNSTIIDLNQDLATSQLIEKWYTDLNGLNEPYSFNLIANDLLNLIDRDELRGPFLSGSVSFCSVSPMRAIPKKWIYLLGMNQDFPFIPTKNEFNLLQESPKSSDNNPLKEGKYFFLESILSARQRFFISYIGIHEKTAIRLSPSTMVNDLLSYLENYIDSKELIFTHPLQEFSNDSDYPGESYHQIYEHTPKDIILPKEERSIPAITQHWTIPNITSLFKNPLIYFYYRQNIELQLLSNTTNQTPEYNFVNIDNGLQKWILDNEYIKSADSDKFQHYLKDSNQILPPLLGVALDKYLEQQNHQLKAIYQSISTPNPVEIKNFTKTQVNSDQFSLFYQIYLDLSLQKQTIFKSSKLSFHSLIEVWLKHLVANISNYPINTQFICKNEDKNPTCIALSAINLEHAQAALNNLFKLIIFIFQNPVGYLAQAKLKKTKIEFRYTPASDIWSLCAQEKSFIFENDDQVIQKLTDLQTLIETELDIHMINADE